MLILPETLAEHNFNPIEGEHPEVIRNSMEELQDKFKRQLK